MIYLLLGPLPFAEIVEERTNDLFFEDGLATCSQGLTEPGFPSCDEGLRIDRDGSLDRAICLGGHEPRDGFVLAGELRYDTQTRPIKIRVAA